MSMIPAVPPRRRRLAVPWLAAAAVSALFLGCTLLWESRPRPIEPEGSIIATTEASDLYALLARGFLKGQLHLDATPDPALITASNPYDPAQRPRVFYPHDASFYQGKFYTYFGPAPALLLYAPWRAITGRDLPTAWAVLSCVTLAYLALSALFLAVAADAYPNASRTALSAGVLALGGASMLLPLVCRPAIYEAAISGGAAAMLGGLYAAWRARSAPNPTRWGAASGLLIGVAIAARPTFGLAALPAWMILSGPSSRGGLGLRWNRGVTAAVLAGATIVAALLAYNHARFGSPFEFGQRYQLSSLNEGAVRHFGPEFIPVQAWLYLLSPLTWSTFLPFVQVAPVGQTPPGFGAHEFSFGLLANVPFVWLAGWTYAQVGRQAARNPIAVPLLAGFVAALTPLLCYYYSCLRYQTEFAVWLALAAALGGLEFERSRPRRAGVFGLAFASLAIVGLVALHTYRQQSPLPDGVARWLNAPARAWHRATDQLPGPLTYDLTFTPQNRSQAGHLLVVEGPSKEFESVAIEPGPGGVPRILVRRVGRGGWQGSIDLTEAQTTGAHRLTVSLSSLYPLSATELAGDLDPAAFRSLKNWLRVDWDGRRLAEMPLAPTDWHAQRVRSHPADLTAAGQTPFPGITAVRRENPHPVVGPVEPWGGARVTWVTDASLRGRSFPLASSGQPGAANFLFLHTAANGDIAFGYDHWGKPAVLSPPVTVSSGTEHTVEFWMPALVATTEATPLEVRVDGRTVWTVLVPFHPTTPQERFLLRNPMGGSACETTFPGATVTAKGLPHPRSRAP